MKFPPAPAKLTLLALCLSGAGLADSCTSPDSGSAVQPLELGAASGSLAPHLFTFRDTLYLSWVQPHTDSGFGLWYSRHAGSGWGPGVTLVHGSRWFVNWADIPKLQVHAGGLAAAWLEKLGESKYAYGVRFAGFRADGQAI